MTVQSGGTLTGAGSVGGALSFTSGGALTLPGSGTGKFTVGSLTISPGAVINVDFTSATNDQIVVTTSGGLTLNSTGGFNLYQAGTLFTFYTPGTYKLVQYSGALNGLDSTWTTVNANNPHVANAQPGSLYSFGASGGYLTLTIATDPSVVFGIWSGPSGNWNTPGDWSSSPNFPQLAGSAAVFGFGSSLTTVTLTGPETVGFLSFTNSNSYVIAGSSALTLNNKGVGVNVNVQAGAANAIQTPLSLGDAASFLLLTNQALAISGTIANASSPETLTVSGGGALALSGNNTYGPAAGAVGTILGAGGLLQVASPTALGAGDISNASSSTLQAAASLSLANNMAIASGAASTVDSQANSLTLNGVISGSGALAKIGGGTLTLGGANIFTGGATVNAGEIIISADNNLGPATPPLSFIGGGLQSSVNGLSLAVSRTILLGGAWGDRRRQRLSRRGRLGLLDRAGFHRQRRRQLGAEQSIGEQLPRQHRHGRSWKDRERSPGRRPSPPASSVFWAMPTERRPIQPLPGGQRGDGQCRGGSFGLRCQHDRSHLWRSRAAPATCLWPIREARM